VRPLSDLILYEEDLSRITTCLSALQHKARSAAVVLIDTSGQLIAEVGDTAALDMTPLASLAAGSIAAAGALAQLLGEKEFSFVFYDGERKRLHLSVIGARAILLVLLEQNSAVALVRLQVKKFSRDIADIVAELSARPAPADGEGRTRSAISDITEADVDNLFEKG
jgi:predicted regulator of Ras-like GTPase activity (Roadblock/LC7/MglB family)